ncbi:hypothetical protein vseg_017747 [Gypsophila vaccaria]
MMPSVMGMNGGDLGCGFGSSSRLAIGQMMFPQAIMDHGQLSNLDITQPFSDGELPHHEDYFDTKSESDNNIDQAFGGEGEEQDPTQRPAKKKKRYHRHTQHQIDEMEAFFKENQHPDDKQRKALGRELGLQPLQIKFWFQNKRTQMKMQIERHENSQLRAENDKLRADNMRYRDALTNASCPSCGGPASLGDMSYDEHSLRLENARLREEVDRISAIAAEYVGKPVNYALMPPPQVPSPRHLDMGPSTDHLLRSVTASNDMEKPVVIELAMAALEELIQMAQMGEPLWAVDPGTGSNVLNRDEYSRAFPKELIPTASELKAEGSSESSIVIMNHLNLVDILMDVNQWSIVFAGIVSRAVIHDVLSTGAAGNNDGVLQVMTAEYQVPSPLVPTRETYFARYCKQQAEGTWAVVDVSLDSLRPGWSTKCRRRPSGCLIQEMPNGYSKVTWVEHVEVYDGGLHNMYLPLVNSALAFGAKRWVSTLDRQCERLACVMASNIPGEAGVITCPEGRKSMLKLAERMVISFCSGVSASTAHTWTTISGSGADDVRVMTRKSIDDPGRPPGIVLCAATSFWLPLPPSKVFEFLRDQNTRCEWDILSNGGGVQEMAHIANGKDMGNCVSLLRVINANLSQSNMLILQESCTDPTASYVIYAPVDIVAMNVVLNGGDPDYVAFLPSGFAILPDGPPNNGSGSSVGSLVTVAFQILVDSVPTAKLSLGSVATVNNLITCTVERIKATLADQTHFA